MEETEPQKDIAMSQNNNTIIKHLLCARYDGNISSLNSPNNHQVEWSYVIHKVNKLGQKENKFCLYTLGPDFKSKMSLD